MHKFLFSAALSLGLAAGTATAAEQPVIGVVNFATCITDSKAGKKEQENLETMRNHMAARIEETDKDLREIASKFEDPEYLDSLSPKAEEELKSRFQTGQEDLARYQNQYYQMMNHAQMQMLQKINGTIAKAAEKVAKEKELDYVMNKEVCFYIRPDFDVTKQVISEMDKNFELDQKAQKVSGNSDQINPFDEMMQDQAG